MPILEQLKGRKSTENMLLCRLRNLVITAFVDDITVLVASEAHEENNRALKMLYTLLVDFASPNGTSFGADKTQIMHLCRDIYQDPWGFLLDYRLTWVEHVAHHLARVSGSTWGLSLLQLRRFYLTCIRPVFAYACALWYVVTTGEVQCRWSINKSLFKQLETEQTQCLKQISGAFQRTSGDMLCKELFVEKLTVYLTRRAQVYRVKNLGIPEGQQLRRSWRRLRPGLTTEVLAKHPYKVVYDEAEIKVRNEALRKLESDIQTKGPFDDIQKEKRLNKLIKSFALAISISRMVEVWGHSLRTRSTLHFGLSKAQSTILLHCRTGIDVLNASLHSMKLSDTYKCPCGHVNAVHNAEHLFMHCESLTAPREHLKKAMPVFSFYNLVTHHPKIASNFVIRYQFVWTAKYMPNPSFGNLAESD
ncbi:zinc knuckle [Colletotrichum incanum]|uniref:Zinc knuckle n=1 Tax=Colletotrichum incanum TaxID=1573173 RepID=A0A161YB33_COLIC|nr:zinc knuckle [Colletotrichum incanum]